MASVYDFVDIEAQNEPNIGGRQGGSGNLPACATRSFNATTKTMQLNYDPIGGEPCDKIAEVTVNGRTRRITLR